MNTITFAVLLLTFVVLSQQEDDAAHEAHKKQMKENVQACVKESGVNPDLPRKAFKDGEFSDDKNFKCFLKCVLQKSGRMDSNGNLNLSSALTYIPPSLDKAKVTAAVDKCKKQLSWQQNASEKLWDPYLHMVINGLM